MGLRLLPDSFDNQQRGHPLALWLFYLATIVTVGRSLAHIFLADGGGRVHLRRVDVLTRHAAAVLADPAVA